MHIRTTRFIFLLLIVTSFNTYSVNAQHAQDTIKVKLVQKLKTLADNNDKEIVNDLITLHEKIGAIKSDYSNVDSVATLKSYKKRLADNIPNYKRLGVMEGFVFNFRKIFKDITQFEVNLINKEVAIAKQESEVAKYRAERATRFAEAAKFYNSIVKQELVTYSDVEKFKSSYPEYANQKAKGGNKTWLELLEKIAQ